MDHSLLDAAAQGLAAILTAAGSFLLGGYRARTRAAAQLQSGEHREREQLFRHYNELILATREMNHGLRGELQAVTAKMETLRIDHAQTMAAVAAEREACRVENETLKAELRHLKADLSDLRKQIRTQG